MVGTDTPEKRQRHNEDELRITNVSNEFGNNKGLKYRKSSQNVVVFGLTMGRAYDFARSTKTMFGVTILCTHEHMTEEVFGC